MIISASYKTDIPAFFGQWFTNRLHAGYCMMRNPMNRRAIRVGLAPSQVDGIVFWTKNFRPFMQYVDGVANTGIPFALQYTINAYPPSLERHVVDWERSVETTLALARRFGPRCVVWRYDTIIISRETPVEFHIENFRRIAAAVSGATDEVVISFMQLYRKTARNMDAMATEFDNPWLDPPLKAKIGLARELSEISARQGIRLTVCSQPEIADGLPASRCIDADRLSDIAGRRVQARTAGNRPGCECAASRDIGDYDTCPHGCVYCYAVRNEATAIRRFRQHDPEGEYLFIDGQDQAPPLSPLPVLNQQELDFGG